MTVMPLKGMVAKHQAREVHGYKAFPAGSPPARLGLEGNQLQRGSIRNVCTPLNVVSGWTGMSVSGAMCVCVCLLLIFASAMRVC